MEGSRLLRRGASLGNDDDNEYATTWADAAAGTKQTNRIERRRRQAEREKSSGNGNNKRKEQHGDALEEATGNLISFSSFSSSFARNPSPPRRFPPDPSLPIPSYSCSLRGCFIK